MNSWSTSAIGSTAASTDALNSSTPRDGKQRSSAFFKSRYLGSWKPSIDRWLDLTGSRLVDTVTPPLWVRDRWRAYQVYLAALMIFVSSRLVVLIGAKFGALLVRVPDPSKWDGSAWYNRLLRWDSGWYYSILRDGYVYNDDVSKSSSVVFYPLYPLASYAVKSLGFDEFQALVLAANLASLVAVLLMTKLVKDLLDDETATLFSVALFCFFPWSLYLSAGYSESLCLVFILLSFILLTRERFVPAAVMAGISLAARPTGIVMMPVVLWQMWRRNTLPWPRLLPRMALCGVLAVSGLLVFMAYLGIKFGHPLAFAAKEAAFHPGDSFLNRFMFAVTLGPFRQFNFSTTGLFTAMPWPLPHYDFSTSGLFACFVAITIWSFWRLPSALSLYALGTLALPYFTMGMAEGGIKRYELMCFPVFICLALLCKRRPWLAFALIGIFAALLLQQTALFSQWYWVA